jgi:hypothetical protein
MDLRLLDTDKRLRVDAARLRLTDAFVHRRSRDSVVWWTDSQAWVDWRPALARLRMVAGRKRFA